MSSTMDTAILRDILIQFLESERILGKQSDLGEQAVRILEKLPGWKCDIRGIRNYEDLPENCRRYVEFIEEQIGFPITMVSNGPGRDDIIYRESPLKRQV